MYNRAAVLAGLRGLVGFRQTRNPQYGLLSADLLESRSGAYVDDVHALITKQNIHAALDTEEYKYYPQWASTPVGYGIGEYVTHKGLIYESISGSEQGIVDDVLNTFTISLFGSSGNLSEPGTSDQWRQVSIMDIYLREVMEASLADVFNKLIQDKKIAGLTKTVFEDNQLFYSVGNRNRKVIKTGRMVGIELNLKKNKDIVIRINRLGIQLDSSNPSLRLYLYHSSQPQYLKSWTVKADRAGSFQWFRLENLNLSYLSMDHDAGGSFRLCYNENELIGQAIPADVDLLNVGSCGSCNPTSYAAFQNYSPHVETHAFSSPIMIDELGQPFWENQNIGYHYDTNFGLNLSFTAECDLTELFLGSQHLFTNAVALAAGVRILNTIAYSTQNKGLTDQIKNEARYELDNKPERSKGLYTQYEEALKALDMDFSSLNSICLPTHKKDRIIRHGAA